MEVVTDTSDPSFDPMHPAIGIIHDLAWSNRQPLFMQADSLEAIANSDPVLRALQGPDELHTALTHEYASTDVIGRLALFTLHGFSLDRIDNVLGDEPGSAARLLGLDGEQASSTIHKIVLGEISFRRSLEGAAKSTDETRGRVNEIVLRDTEGYAFRVCTNAEKEAVLLMAAGLTYRQAAARQGVKEEDSIVLVDNGLNRASNAALHRPEPMYGLSDHSLENKFYLQIAGQMVQETAFEEWVTLLQNPDDAILLINTALKYGSVKMAADEIGISGSQAINRLTGYVNTLDRIRTGTFRSDGYASELRDLAASADDLFGVIDKMSWPSRIAFIGDWLGLQPYELDQLGYTFSKNQKSRARDAFQRIRDVGKPKERSVVLELSTLLRGMDENEIRRISTILPPIQQYIVYSVMNGAVTPEELQKDGEELSAEGFRMRVIRTMNSIHKAKAE